MDKWSSVSITETFNPTTKSWHLVLGYYQQSGLQCISTGIKLIFNIFYEHAAWQSHSITRKVVMGLQGISRPQKIMDCMYFPFICKCWLHLLSYMSSGYFNSFMFKKKIFRDHHWLPPKCTSCVLCHE